MLAMKSALQGDLGVTYDMSCLSDPIDRTDAASWFVCGPVSGRGGTCVSLPVLYAAIGRRLGYPLFFVRAKEHYLLRWEEPSERFNIECASPGFEPRDDGYYLVRPKPLTERDLATGRYLRNLTPREELAVCFSMRGYCLLDHLRIDEAIEAYEAAATLCPSDPAYIAAGRIATAVATYLDYEDAGADFDSRVPELARTPPFAAARRELARIRFLHARREARRADALTATACFDAVPC
jgi:regulator of sirC expression with transglutaminase-like and TPR domain